jgi:hypothetical protein
MYEQDNQKLKKYLRGSGDAKLMDWHAWLRDLSAADREELELEVLAATSRAELSDYARQYYLHFCTDTEDGRLRSIEHAFVTAQLENRAPEEVAKLEDMYFEHAKELLKLREQGK